MAIDFSRARSLLQLCDLKGLFIDELGWDKAGQPFILSVAGEEYQLTPFAKKCGLVVYRCDSCGGGSIRFPERNTRVKIHRELTKTTYEHILVFITPDSTTQIWQWVRRVPGRPIAFREHPYHHAQSGDALLQKLQFLAVSLEEEEQGVTLTDITRRTRAAFDVDRITRRFYDRFKKEHGAFLAFIKGIEVPEDSEWYASVMLNRLMFIYFIQKKGFLNGDPDYLRNRLERCKRDHGKDKFYSFYRYFLLRLFHEGLGSKTRTQELEILLGKIPYLNGGLFEIHELEVPERYGRTIQIPDQAFERIFDYFDQYQWHLDERPLKADNEINPDVLGYIFEKYINQKQMGAYYTKEDITEYISKNTVIPFLFNAARAKCKVAFENPKGSTIWDLLKIDPDRYIYTEAKHGIVDEAGTVVPDRDLPDFVKQGMHDVQSRMFDKRYNLQQAPAGDTYRLVTETWREYVYRRIRCIDTRDKLRLGEVRDINDFISLNLNIRQFAQDVITNCEGPELLRAFWHAIEKVTVLDPACGSGAFLFAALSILEPLYEACLDRMEAFLEEEASKVKKDKLRYTKNACPILPNGKLEDFSKLLESVAEHPNERYFVLKRIILNNLFGVDIMVEAIEICKLRLFLKLAAQVEPDVNSSNLGIEPLPDIDFNVRSGNSLVGYPSIEEVGNAFDGKLDLYDAVARIQKAAEEAAVAFMGFRQMQTDEDTASEEFSSAKRKLRSKLASLNQELNSYLASEYGKDVSQKAIYEKWRTSHLPFHWVAEFYSIMAGGGFDVVIGNPPYVEYSKVGKYKVRNYSTQACGNLYVFTVERSSVLCSSRGRIGMIIPISVACSGAMQPLRDELALASRSYWLSHYSNRPGQLFTGAQNRLTIFLTTSRQLQPVQFSTRYHRWDAKRGERENLFPTMQYQILSTSIPMFHKLLPKVGCSQAMTALVKIQANKNVGYFASRHGHHKIYWVRVPGYFCQFLLEAPLARPEAGGPPRLRGEVNSIGFDDESRCRVIHALLNSSTYYQFFCSFTDTRHINPSDVSGFPVNLESFGRQTKEKLISLSLKLENCFAVHTTQWRKSGLLIDSVDAKRCKTIIDEIDRVLAQHYGFTEEELDFIINYDIKYRMGNDTEDNEQ
jgi:hypothetical protein